MGRPSPRHGAAVRGDGRKILPGLWLRKFCGRYIFPGLLKRDVVTPAPESPQGNRPQGWRRKVDCAIRREVYLIHRQVCRSAVSARQGRSDRNGRRSQAVFRHRTVAAARNRASGFEGDGCAPSSRLESGLTTGCRQGSRAGLRPRLRKSEQQKRHNRKCLTP